MIFHKYFYFIFLFKLITITTARIPTSSISSNSKREAPIITEEVIETHSKNLVPNAGLPFQQPPLFRGPRPLPLGIEQWRECNLWCRLRVFLEERKLIKNEFFTRQNVIKNDYGSQKIPGLFVYNSLLKRQKDIATRNNEFQKATELTAHWYRPLFTLLQILLPQFGPNLSPVLTGRVPHPPPPPPQGLPPPPPLVPKIQPVLIPKGGPVLPEPILGPRIPPPPQPVVIPKGTPPIKLELAPKGFVSQEPFPPPGVPLPLQTGGYFQSIPTPQALIDHGAHVGTTSTRIEKNVVTPIPAPPLPSPAASPLNPPQPILSILQPPFLTEEVSISVVSPSPTPLITPAFSPSPTPTQLSRGESGIVVTTVQPPSSTTLIK